MSATRHQVHTNLGLDVTAVEPEHDTHEAHDVRPPHVDPHAREEMQEGWLPDHGTNFGLVLPVEDGSSLEEVVVTTLPAQRVLRVEVHAPMAEVGAAMQTAFQRLFTHVGATGAVVDGPPFALYPEMPADTVHFLLCVPTGAGAVAGDGVVVEEIPPQRAATLRYRGPYDTIGPSWQRLLAWVSDHDARVVGPMREVYLDDPDTCGPQGPETLLAVPIE